MLMTCVRPHPTTRSLFFCFRSGVSVGAPSNLVGGVPLWWLLAARLNIDPDSLTTSGLSAGMFFGGVLPLFPVIQVPFSVCVVCVAVHASMLTSPVAVECHSQDETWYACVHVYCIVDVHTGDDVLVIVVLPDGDDFLIPMLPITV